MLLCELEFLPLVFGFSIPVCGMVSLWHWCVVICLSTTLSSSSVIEWEMWFIPLWISAITVCVDAFNYNPQYVMKSNLIFGTVFFFPAIAFQYICILSISLCSFTVSSPSIPPCVQIANLCIPSMWMSLVAVQTDPPVALLTKQLLNKCLLYKSTLTATTSTTSVARSTYTEVVRI